MAAKRDGAAFAGRRGQVARQFGRRSVHLPAQVPIQHSTLMQARFFVGRQSVLAPQSGRRVVLILVVPVVSNLLVVFVKLGMALLVLTASLSPVLGQSRAACQNRAGSRDQ